MQHRHTIRISQTYFDEANSAAAASQTAIPARMMDALSRVAATVEEGHRLHDVVSRIRAQERFLPLPRVPMRVTISRVIAAHEAPPSPKPLVFDTVRVGPDKLLEGQDKCPICLVEFEKNDKGNVLPCKHGFHEQCIKEWTKNHPTCPICRLHLS